MNPAQWLESRYDRCVSLRRECEEVAHHWSRATDPDESLALARQHRAISRELTELGDQT